MEGVVGQEGDIVGIIVALSVLRSSLGKKNGKDKENIVVRVSLGLKTENFRTP